MRCHLGLLLLCFALVLKPLSGGQTHKKAAPPTTDEIARAWIGFDGGGSDFIRVELHADHSGYLAFVAPRNFVTHDYGVQLYRVTKWSLDGFHITCDLSPISTNAESAQATGEFFVSSLHLTIHGDKRRWKIEPTLYMEQRVDESNKETKDFIAAEQHR